MPNLQQLLSVVSCSLRLWLCYFFVSIPFGHCDYHMCTTEQCEYVENPACLFDVGRGTFASTVGEREGVFKVFCPDGQPYKTAWVVEDTARYLDCAAIPSIIDLAKGLQFYRLCVFRRKLESDWILQLGHMETLFFQPAQCSIEPSLYPVFQGTLQVTDILPVAIGAAQITCDDYSKRIYFTKSPVYAFWLWSNVRFHYFWLGLEDIRFYFRVAGRSVDGDVVGVCKHNKSNGEYEEISNGVFDIAKQVDVGEHYITCSSEEFNLEATRKVFLVRQSECGSECTPALLVLDIPKSEPLNYRFCRCDKTFLQQFSDSSNPFDLETSDVLDCTSDRAKELNLSRGSFQLMPGRIYERISVINCVICWTVDKCKQKRTLVIIRDDPTIEVKIELATSGVYEITDKKPELSACIRWSDRSECTSDLQQFISVHCSLSNVTGIISSGWYNVKCGNEEMNISQVFRIAIYNTSDMLVNCLPSPLILKKFHQKTVQLCNLLDFWGSDSITLPKIQCFSVPDGLVVINGDLTINPTENITRHYLVHCESAINSPVHIFIEDPPNLTLELFTEVNRSFLLTELNQSFAACLKWSTENKCNPEANELLRVTCQTDYVPPGSDWAKITCRSKPAERIQSFHVPIFDDRTLKLDCINKFSLVDREKFIRLPVCVWSTEAPLPPNYTVRFPQLKIDCSTDPNIFPINDGIWQVHETTPPIGAYKISCNRFNDSIDLFYIDKSVELIADPDREFYLFGHGLTVRFLIDYPPFIPDYVANSTKLICTIKTPDESMLLDEGLSFYSGQDLVIGDSTNAESQRGAHVVNCSDKYVQRLKFINIFKEEDFHLKILEPIEPIIMVNETKTFTCIIETTDVLNFTLENDAQWLPETTIGLQQVGNRVQTSKQSRIGLYEPKCVFHWYELRLEKEIHFIIYKNFRQFSLEQVPPDRVVLLEEDQPLVVRIKMQNFPSPRIQALLDQESRNCSGTVTMVNGTTVPVVFQNFIPFSSIPPGLVRLDCNCRLTGCATKFVSFVTRKNLIQLHCRRRIIIDLEEGEARQLVCVRRLELPTKWASELHVSRIIRVSTNCYEVGRRLRTERGYLLITIPYPPLGEYNVSCAEDTRFIPVYIIRRILMLIPDPQKDLYFFGENSSISFYMAYADAQSHQIALLNRTDLNCLIRAPLHWDWRRIQSPYNFVENRLYLNVTARFRHSARYRIQCQLFDGAVVRTAEVQIVNGSDLSLIVTSPNRDRYEEGETIVYTCTLAGKAGLDMHAVENRPSWRLTLGGYVYVKDNKMVIDEFTASGRHHAECVYKDDGVHLSQTVKFTFLRKKDKLNINIKPAGDPIVLTAKGALSVYLYWTFVYPNGSEVIRLESISSCTLRYLDNPDLVPVNFTKSIDFQWLTNGHANIICYTMDGKHHTTATVNLVKHSDFRLFCTNEFLVDVGKITKFFVCKYVLAIEPVSGGPQISKKSIVCKSLSHPLDFDEGVLLLDKKPVILGYYTIMCGDEKRNVTLFLYDNSLVIGDYPPKPYYVFRTPDKVAVWFCFVRKKRIFPVKLRNTTVFCRFLNAALRPVRFKEMEFQLNEIHSNMKYIRGIVQCSAFNGTITRYCRIDLVGHSTFYLKVVEQIKRVHLRTQSTVYTCILQNEVKEVDEVLREAPRWFSEGQHIKSFGNQLILDTDSPVGLYNVQCLYKQGTSYITLNLSLLLCDETNVSIAITPEHILLNAIETNMVQAKLIWDCPAHKLSEFSGFTVQCNITYRWPDGVAPITFVDRIMINQLKVGYAQFNCFSIDSHYSQLFDRRIFDANDFHTECFPAVYIFLGQSKQTSYQLCSRELNRTEPWISTIPEENWPKLPVECNEPNGKLKIENGYMLVDSQIPEAGEYEVVCADSDARSIVTLVDSSVQLVTVPRRKFFILDGDIQPMFVFQTIGQRSMNSELIDIPDMTCNVTTAPQVEFMLNEFDQILLPTDSGTFGDTSVVHMVQCQAFRGAVVRSISLHLVAKKDVKLQIIGSNHTTHQQDEAFAYYCQVANPKWLADLIRPTFVPPYPPEVSQNGNRVLLPRNMPLGKHRLNCSLTVQGLTNVSTTVQFTVVPSERQHKELSISTFSHPLFKLSDPIPRVFCRPSGNMERIVVEWKRIHGNDLYVSRREKLEPGSSLIIQPDAIHSGPSSFVCQATEDNRCYSKLLIYYRYEGKNSLSISTQVRTQFFHTYLTCKTNLIPDELNAYTWTILLNNGVSWQAERNRIKMFGSFHLTARSYQRCRVNQLYLGHSFSTESVVIFNEIKYRAEVEFVPHLPVYRSSMWLRCRVTESDRYTSQPYMIFTRYPPQFRPYLFYRAVDFSDGFIGGTYTVVCFYINSNLILLSRELQFEFHENPTAVGIHKEFDSAGDPEKTRLKCVPNGYPPLVLDANWTIINGSDFAFTREEYDFVLTKFALQGKYYIRCDALVGFDNHVIRMNTTAWILVEASKASDVKKVACSSNIQFAIPIGLSIVCWMIMYFNFCALLIRINRQTKRKIKKRQLSFVYVTYDTRILGRHCGSQFRALIRNFDTVQQIIQQIIIHRQKSREATAKNAGRKRVRAPRYRRNAGWKERRARVNPEARSP